MAGLLGVDYYPCFPRVRSYSRSNLKETTVSIYSVSCSCCSSLVLPRTLTDLNTKVLVQNPITFQSHERADRNDIALEVLQVLVVYQYHWYSMIEPKLEM
jgi:hypothetical protein